MRKFEKSTVFISGKVVPFCNEILGIQNYQIFVLVIVGKFNLIILNMSVVHFITSSVEDIFTLEYQHILHLVRRILISFPITSFILIHSVISWLAVVIMENDKHDKDISCAVKSNICKMHGIFQLINPTMNLLHLRICRGRSRDGICLLLGQKNFNIVQIFLHPHENKEIESLHKITSRNDRLGHLFQWFVSEMKMIRPNREQKNQAHSM
ncbi:hypothetical protein T4D_12363 [Trichinella pseudospiralis]|uniref:Uncharacterized protein n=1 Tax=Trichinella pseudospiralis TaxID=6337 RepID=A0A0V1FMX6_TRIPS|nr:hypothetical protein T4D_12363 [Trichinella pseudospiralis]